MHSFNGEGAIPPSLLISLNQPPSVGR